jgi:hypothetical protein
MPNLTMLRGKKELTRCAQHKVCHTEVCTVHGHAIAPLKFFSRLPAELWRNVDLFLDVVSATCLKYSCKPAYSLFSQAVPRCQSPEKFHELQRHLLRDWYKTPSEQICIMCRTSRPRCRIQPRAIAEAGIEKSIPTTGGIKLTADVILCQACHVEVRNRNFTHRSGDITGPLDDFWHHEWQILDR